MHDYHSARQSCHGEGHLRQMALYTLTLVAAMILASGAVAAMSEEADAKVTATLSGTTVTLSGSGDYDSSDYNSNTDITKTAANLARGYFSGVSSSELYLW